MKDVNTTWLPHLDEEVINGIQGNYLDAYVVALEGWRRGLTLKWHTKDSPNFKNIKSWYVDQPGQLFSLHSQEKSHYFFRTRGDLVSNKAVEQGMDKETTKKMLQAKQIPVPQGKTFNINHPTEKIYEYIEQLEYPVVLKPLDGSFGRGVFSDIQTEAEVEQALNYIFNELKEQDIIVEKHIYGKDYRIYVVGDEVVGAILRIPPNVKGNGKNTIQELIQQKNEQRKINPRLGHCSLTVNDEVIHYLNRNGYQLQSVPQRNEIVYLSDKGNVSIGGDPVDVLDELTEEIKDIAIQSLRAIPNFPHGAVDIISEGSNKGSVIELNPTAQLGGILFPLKGKPQDIPKKIIDYYFPETIQKTTHHNFYFDYKQALIPLEKNIAYETTVSHLITNNIVAKEIVLEGESVNELQFKQSLKKQALDYEIAGFIQTNGHRKLSLIIGGPEQSIQNYIEKSLKNHSKIKTMKIRDTKKQIKSGFEIENAQENILENLKDKHQKITQLQRKQRQLQKQYTNMLNSTSWKITKPFRFFIGLFKK